MASQGYPRRGPRHPRGPGERTGEASKYSARTSKSSTSSSSDSEQDEPRLEEELKEAKQEMMKMEQKMKKMAEWKTSAGEELKRKERQIKEMKEKMEKQEEEAKLLQEERDALSQRAKYYQGQEIKLKREMDELERETTREIKRLKAALRKEEEDHTKEKEETERHAIEIVQLNEEMEELRRKYEELRDFKKRCVKILTGESVHLSEVEEFTWMVGGDTRQLHVAVSLSADSLLQDVMNSDPRRCWESNIRGWNPLQLAVARGDERAIQALWEPQVAKNAFPPLLFLAVVNQNVAAAKMIKDKRMDMEETYREAKAIDLAKTLENPHLEKILWKCNFCFGIEWVRLNFFHLLNLLNQILSCTDWSEVDMKRFGDLLLYQQQQQHQQQQSRDHYYSDREQGYERERKRSRSRSSGSSSNKRLLHGENRRHDCQSGQGHPVTLSPRPDYPERDSPSPQDYYRPQPSPDVHPCQEGPTRKGLPNLGNTCYMNCVLQCLCHVEPLTDHFKELRGDITRQGDMVQAMVKLWASLEYGGDQEERVREVKRKAGKRDPRFRGNQQEEAHDFLSCMLEWLHADMLKSRTYSDGGVGDLGKGTSKISSLFCTVNVTAIICHKGNDSELNRNNEATFNLSLPAPKEGPRTLKGLLDKYYKSQEVEWDCDSCRRTHMCRNDIWIKNLPQVLVLHLSRPSDIATSSQKIKISYPLEGLVVDNTKDKTSRTYSLAGVCCHEGGMAAGHYTAYCRSGKQWFSFNDSYVYSVDSKKVRDRPSAHILFYVAEDTLPPHPSAGEGMPV